ncbi:MAG TPA: DUF2437 domain-containing protein, partial [Planctomycetes bacterium]|nr:DUF2437 domain-containing protein [Planctomycetota bacterium]
MQLVKYQVADTVAVGIQEQDQIVPLDLAGDVASLQDILESENPAATAESLRTDGSIAADAVTLLAPIDQQEVWAAGVTYKRSQTARMEESETSASC